MMDWKKQILAGVLLVLLTGGFVSAEMRFWYDRDGNYFQGELVREQLGNFYFKDASGATRSVAVTNLVANDLKYIRSMVPPKINLRFTRKIKPAPAGAYRTQVDRRMIVTGTAKISKVDKTPFFGTLRAELYLVGEELVTEYNMLMGRKTFPIRFPEEKKSSVEVSMSVVTRDFPEHSGEQRGWRYKGYAVVILGPNGAVLKTETNLSWLKDETLPAFRRFKEFNFFDDECRKKSTPRPRYDPGRSF